MLLPGADPRRDEDGEERHDGRPGPHVGGLSRLLKNAPFGVFQRPASAGGTLASTGSAVSVRDQADALERHEAFADQLIEVRNEGGDPLGRVDDLDHHREVL